MAHSSSALSLGKPGQDIAMITKSATVTSSASGPLVDRLWAAGDYNFVRYAVLAVVGSLVLTISAKVQVPFYPVPMTLQTLAVLLIGAAYGWRLGVASVGLYLMQGLMGFPVFANTPPAIAGLAYFMGPTAGFLMGFVASVALVGFAVERGAARSLPVLTGVVLLAETLVFGLGFAWLAQFATFASGAVGLGFGKAFAAIQPFLLGDLLKSAIAVAAITLFARKV
jgi:biotin transport system substrate-specific component